MAPASTALAPVRAVADVERAARNAATLTCVLMILDEQDDGRFADRRRDECQKHHVRRGLAGAPALGRKFQ